MLTASIKSLLCLVGKAFQRTLEGQQFAPVKGMQVRYYKSRLTPNFNSFEFNNQYVLPNASVDYCLWCGFGSLDIMVITRYFGLGWPFTLLIY